MLNSKLRELITQLLNELEESQKEAASLREKIKYYESLYPKKEEVLEDQNLIDFSSITSSVESIGIISWCGLLIFVIIFQNNVIVEFYV